MSRLPADIGHADAAASHQGDWARTPERSNMLALRFVCWLALTFGRRVTRLVLHPITLYFLIFAPGPRRNIKRYLTRAIGPQMDWRDGYRLIHAFASIVLDRVYFLRGRLDLFDIQVEGVEGTDAEAQAGRGAFLMGAHVGSFEALGACRYKSADPEHLKLAMLMYPDNAQQINAVLGAISDPAFRPHIIALGRPNSMLALRDWMDAGGLAGLLVDRTLPQDAASQHRGNSVVIDFLGAPATFNDAPFRLAALLRRKVFFMVGLYLGGARYEIRFEPLVDFSAGATGLQREQLVREAVEAYVAKLESLCREHPYNWFNFHDFWLEDAR